MPPTDNAASADASAATPAGVEAPGAAAPQIVEGAAPASEAPSDTVADAASASNAATPTDAPGAIEGDNDADPPRRKRGRPSKAELAARLNGTTPAPPRPAPAAAPVVPLPAMHNYDAVAEQAANLWFNVPQLALGQEWEPEGNEPQLVKAAFKDYFQANQIGRIPPEWGLALTLIAYTAKRFNRPTIKQRIFGAYEWLKAKAKFGR